MALEKAVVELVAFRRQARESYNAFVTCRRGSGLAGKRTKESSAAVGVSPNTAKDRPPAKRGLVPTCRRLTYESSSTGKSSSSVLHAVWQFQ